MTTNFDFRSDDHVESPKAASQEVNGLERQDVQNPNNVKYNEYTFHDPFQSNAETFPEHSSAQASGTSHGYSDGSEESKPGPPPVKPKKARTFLTHEQVLEALDFKKINSSAGRSDKVLSCELAEKFGVCPKTILNIWSGRTWLRATFPLDASKAPLAHRLLKRPGRPKGSKDSKPRQKTVQNNNGAQDHQTQQQHRADMVSPSGPEQFYICTDSLSRTIDSDMSIWSTTTRSESGTFSGFDDPLRQAFGDAARLISENEGIDPPQDFIQFQLSDFQQCYTDDGSSGSAWAGLPLLCSQTDQIPDEALASPSVQFTDPFHSDWPFWSRTRVNSISYSW